MITRAGIEIPRTVIASPNDHLAPGPTRCMIGSRVWSAAGRSGGPTVQGGIVTRAVVENGEAVKASPNDHLATCPDCCVANTRGRSIVRRGYPRVCAGIVAATGTRGITGG